jgi:hypothetical protein
MSAFAMTPLPRQYDPRDLGQVQNDEEQIPGHLAQEAGYLVGFVEIAAQNPNRAP